MRRVSRRRGVQIRAIEFAEAGEAEETERADHLVFHDFQHPHDPGLAARGQSVALHAAEPDEIGAERERLHREVGMARDQALKDIWEHTARLATLVSAKTIKRDLGIDDHRRLVDEAVAELGKTVSATRQQAWS